MQNEEKNAICKLCHNEQTFETVPVAETAVQEMLIILQLKLDEDIYRKPVVCKNCLENLQKCFEFKTNCLYMENCINSFKNNGDSSNVELKEVYLSRNKGENDVNIPKNHTVCRLCMKLAEFDCCTPLNNVMNNMAAKKILTWFPQLNLDVTKDPMMCTPCHDCLYSYCSFMENCLGAEGEIQRESEGTNKKNQEQLDVVLKFEPQNISSNKSAYADVNIHMYYKGAEVFDENGLKHEKVIKKEIQELHVKDEEPDEAQVFATNSENNIIRIMKCYENDTNFETDTKHDNVMETCEFDMKLEEIDIKTEGDVTRSQDVMLMSSPVEVKRTLVNKKSPTEKMYKCKRCSYRTNHKYVLVNQHMPLHKDASEVRTYQCETCKFETIHKYSLKNHLIVHKDPSEVVLYQCEKCNYQSKFKRYMKEHLRSHKNGSEIRMYSCEFCPHQARQKSNLKSHMRIHANDSEVKMYNCEVCSFKTRYMSALKKHTLIHKSASEVQMYQCEICTYETRYKNILRTHIRAHKSASKKTNSYRCGICTYQSKYVHSFKKHMLIHKNASGVVVYQCDKCEYNTTVKNSFKVHMVVHKDSSEVTTYQCEMCEYKTKYKNNMRVHLLIHKDASEIAMHRCKFCAYRTKYKSHLKEHMLIHKDPSSLTMYHCEMCKYKTKYKSGLRSHVLIHKLASEVTIYQCATCEYKTKWKQALKTHMLNHKN